MPSRCAAAKLLLPAVAADGVGPSGTGSLAPLRIESAAHRGDTAVAPSSKKKSGLQGLAGEVLTICRRGCFGTRLSRLAVAVHRPVRLFSYAFVHRPKCLFSYAFVSIKKSHRLNFFVSLEALRR